MSIDYFADLSQKSSDVTTLEHFITQYFQLKALGMNKDADALKDKWKKESTSTNIDFQQFGVLWDLIQYPKIEFTSLPPYSFLLQFKFALYKPYISRDEQDFYIIDNPIRKDKVFGLPYIAPSSWKGSLRAAI